MRDELEAKLLSTAQDLYELEIRAGDVVPGMENFMESAVEQLVKDYAELSALAQKMAAPSADEGSRGDLIPGALLERVDSLQNPHELTKELLVTALEQNQYGNAKMHAYGTFHDLLAEQLAEAFPEMRELLQLPGIKEDEHKPAATSDPTENYIKIEGRASPAEPASTVRQEVPASQELPSFPVLPAAQVKADDDVQMD